MDEDTHVVIVKRLITDLTGLQRQYVQTGDEKAQYYARSIYDQLLTFLEGSRYG